jgi:hypothetical protein
MYLSTAALLVSRSSFLAELIGAVQAFSPTAYVASHYCCCAVVASISRGRAFIDFTLTFHGLIDQLRATRSTRFDASLHGHI